MMRKLAVIIIVFIITLPYSGSSQNSVDSLLLKSEDVKFCNCDSDICFGGTLLIPEADKLCPVVIFVSGSGRQDRDGTMAGHKMFKTIAEYLAKKGIASLRTDDRGVGETTGIYEESTTADFADDVLAAVSFLKSRPDIDRENIGLIGHSEGGTAAAIAASKSSNVAFLVSLAGLATNGLEALKTQNRSLVEKSAIPDYNKKRSIEINELMFETAYRYAGSDSMEFKLNETYRKWKIKDDEYFKTLNIEFDHFRFSVYSYVLNATGPWYRYFIRFEPEEFISKIKIPVLALNGDKDVMVDCKENLGHWEEFLKEAGNRDVTIKVFHGLNHLFLPCETCTQQEYRQLKGKFSSEVLEVVGNWIVDQIDH
jgi:uncharacterized protein